MPDDRQANAAAPIFDQAPDEGRWMRVDDAARFLGINSRTVYRWVKRGRLRDRVDATGARQVLVRHAGLEADDAAPIWEAKPGRQWGGGATDRRVSDTGPDTTTDTASTRDTPRDGSEAVSDTDSGDTRSGPEVVHAAMVLSERRASSAEMQVREARERERSARRGMWISVAVAAALGVAASAGGVWATWAIGKRQARAEVAEANAMQLERAVETHRATAAQTREELEAERRRAEALDQERRDVTARLLGAQQLTAELREELRRAEAALARPAMSDLVGPPAGALPGQR